MLDNTIVTDECLEFFLQNPEPVLCWVLLVTHLLILSYVIWVNVKDDFLYESLIGTRGSIETLETKLSKVHNTKVRLTFVETDDTNSHLWLDTNLEFTANGVDYDLFAIGTNMGGVYYVTEINKL